MHMRCDSSVSESEPQYSEASDDDMLQVNLARSQLGGNDMKRKDPIQTPLYASIQFIRKLLYCIPSSCRYVKKAQNPSRIALPLKISLSNYQYPIWILAHPGSLPLTLRFVPGVAPRSRRIRSAAVRLKHVATAKPLSGSAPASNNNWTRSARSGDPLRSQLILSKNYHTK